MLNIGFLFGAGAECGYGLPSGGKFALDIFRQDVSKSKNEFKKMREEIDSSNSYATNWLPQDYQSKNIGSYGKSVFETIIRDTIEHNRDKIIMKVNSFDKIAAEERESIQKKYQKDIISIIEGKIETKIDNINLKQRMAFTDEFKEGNKIFENNFLAALLEIYTKKLLQREADRLELKKILLSIFQLQIGALSENLARKITDNLFKKNESNADFFDDIGECLSINYQTTGMVGLEYVTKKKDDREGADDDDILIQFSINIIESIYASVLDYKSLIDSNWHYLYCPKEEWAKFCKISIFLLTVRNYINGCIEGCKISSEGYYHDLKESLGKDFNTNIIATTNYNSFIQEVLGREIIYLNGAVNILYDPYLNQLDLKEKFDSVAEKHFLVPLMFTQSGTKPMTSVSMLIKYVRMYEKLKEADGICVVGFGFNEDDEHINGIFRELIDKDNKKIYIVDIDFQNEFEKRKKVGQKLKIRNSSNIIFVTVDKHRLSNEKLWTKSLTNKINQSLGTENVISNS